MNAIYTKRLAYWTAVLFVLWLMLSESFNALHMAVGFSAALLVALLRTDLRAERTYAIRWWRALLYIPWLFSRILVSGVHVSYLILHPRLPIKPVLFRHRADLGSDEAVLLMGNSITLTPGTVTVEADDEELIVHALDEDSTGDVLSQRLEKMVARVFPAGGGRR
ncbi:MAG: ABC transporter permease [Acidobacteriia bacterium]|nr:ABC transporter permease [Terriglobia bacterium]